MIPQQTTRRNETLEIVAWTTVALTVATAFQLYLVSRGLTAISWDGSARTVVAYRWMLDKYFFRPSAWLPFHRIAVGLTLQVWRDLILAPRVFSFVFGLATVWSVVWLSRELFANRLTAILSAVIAAFLAHRLVLSIVPLSSIVFSAIAISGLALVARWLASGKPVTLCMAGLVLGLSSTVRYEGWLMSAVFLVVATVVILRSGRLKEIPFLIVAASLMAAFPLFWITMHTVETGQPLGFLGPGSTAYPMKRALLKNPMTQFVVHGFLTGNLVGFASLATRAWREVRYLLFAAISFVPLAILSAVLLVSSKSQSGPSWRMVCVWSLVLVPFTADAIISLIGSEKASRRMLGGTLILFLTAASLGLAERIRLNSTDSFPPSDFEVGALLREYLEEEPEARILIESRRSWYLNVLVASQRPEVFVPNEGIPGLGRPIVRQPHDFWSGSQAEQLGIRLLVFRSPDHKLGLAQDPDLHCLGEFGSWVVYEVVGGEGSG